MKVFCKYKCQKVVDLQTDLNKMTHFLIEILD
jgi:hypothetical protein